jgi:hypothetical protein
MNTSFALGIGCCAVAAWHTDVYHTTVGESRDVDVGAMIYDELLYHGRQTINELIRNLGGIEAPGIDD